MIGEDEKENDLLILKNGPQRQRLWSYPSKNKVSLSQPHGHLWEWAWCPHLLPNLFTPSSALHTSADPPISVPGAMGSLPQKTSANPANISCYILQELSSYSRNGRSHFTGRPEHKLLRYAPSNWEPNAAHQTKRDSTDSYCERKSG